MRDKPVYVADFETRNNDYNINNEITSVWLWDICDIATLSHISGNNLDSFMEVISKQSPCVIYTHNLKFDGLFIIDWLLKHGYNHSIEKKLDSYDFSTLVTEVKVFYNIKICFKTNSKKTKKIVEFRDSTKKIKGSVREIAESYKLPIAKGEIDYKLFRLENYKATPEEISYIENDTEIIARVLKMQYSKDLTRLTTSSDTLMLYKNFVGKFFNVLFPCVSLEVDNFIRKSYRGGVVQVSDNFKEKIINKKVYVYDVNSMYPDKMCNKLLPYGEPIYYSGEYEPDDKHPLFIQRLEVCLSVKKGYKPTILLSNNKWGRLEYLTNTNGQMIELTLTSVDLSLMLEHYEIYDINYLDGYKFRGSKKLFKEFIFPLYESKCNSTGAEKELFKLLLNGLYGKYATNPKHIQKIPYLEDDTVKWKNGEVTYDKPIYTAVSSFITAYAREQLFDVIQKNYDNFVYCDTDSVHLVDKIVGAEVDSKKLGAWKEEKTYIKSKYLAQKTYYGLTENGKIDLKIAGCPKNVKEQIDLNNFFFDNKFFGKLLPKAVNGGVVLKDTEFTLKRR